MVDIFLPHAEFAEPEAALLASRLDSLTGRTVGIVNNSWRCMDVIADELDALLCRDFGVEAIDQRRISAAQTLPSDAVEEMAATCDAVVVGLGN